VSNMIDRRHGWRARSMAGLGAAALLVSGSSLALAQDDGPFVAEGRAEGEVVIATAGGTFQEALGNSFYSQFTELTGINVTPVTINPAEQWAKVKADTEVGNVQWDVVNVGPDSLVLQQEFLADLGPNCEEIPNMAVNAAEGVCQQHGFLYILGGYIGGANTEAFPDGVPTDVAGFFDTETYPGGRCLSSSEPTYNMMLALAADGVTQEELWPLDIDRALAKLDTLKPHIAAWWETGDQSMQNWRNGECVLSTFFAGRVKALQREGEPAAQIWQGFPRDISGFGILAEAPHPNAARAFANYFFSDDAAQGAADFAETTNYDPANVKGQALMDPADDATRATNPDNWNAMLALDVQALQEQQTEIVERWQEWISQ
jgi:mannopine transport system substrate-binding protein